MKSPKLQIAGRALLAASLFIVPVHSWAQESAGVVRKLITKTAAVYPPLARSMNLHGVVKLEAHVAPNGTVKSVVVKGGHPILTQSAVTAVGHWRFEPAPRETTEPVEIAFNLD